MRNLQIINEKTMKRQTGNTHTHEIQWKIKY